MRLQPHIILNTLFARKTIIYITIFTAFNRDGTTYLVRGYSVCRASWMAIHAISQSLMAKLVSMHKNGFQTTRSPDKKKTKTKTYIAKAWMESSFQKMGDKMPDSPIIHSRYKIQLITQFSGPEFVLDLRSGSVYISGYWRYI